MERESIGWMRSGGESVGILESLIMSAVGDALGYPVESGAVSAVEGFVDWTDPKFGYEVKKGEYSDDTQLTLATARSIWEGRFQVEYFAYVELPLWTYYQRGAGKSTMSASINMFTRYIRWNNNFYPGYENAGGNGAAMRIAPIVYSTIGDCYEKMVIDVFKNTVVTHGHPMAFVGALTMASILRSAIQSRGNFDLENARIFLETVLRNALKVIASDPGMEEWLKIYRGDFKDGFIRESSRMLSNLGGIEGRGYAEYCSEVGEFENPGSSLSSVSCAIHAFVKHVDDPLTGLLEVVNTGGTDTDTIASMAGSLYGASMDGIPERIEPLVEDLQDSEYMRRMAEIVSAGGTKRNWKRETVREWAEDFKEKSLEGKIPDWHPVFGRMEERARRKGKRYTAIEAETREGQKVFFLVRSS